MKWLTDMAVVLRVIVVVATALLGALGGVTVDRTLVAPAPTAAPVGDGR